MNNYKIWCTYHRDGIPNEYNLYNSDNFQLFNDDIKTLAEDNINYLHDYLCELTTYYYVWKNNIKSDIVGFCHYSKHLQYLDYEKLNKFGFCAHSATYYPSNIIVTNRFEDKYPQHYINYAFVFYLKHKYNINIFNYAHTHDYIFYSWHNMYFFTWKVFCDICDFIFGYLNYVFPNDSWKIKSNLDFLTKMHIPICNEELLSKSAWFTRTLSIAFEWFIGIYLGIKYTNQIRDEYWWYSSKTNKYCIACNNYENNIDNITKWIKQNIKSGATYYIIKTYNNDLHKQIQNDENNSLLNKYVYKLFTCCSDEEYNICKNKLLEQENIKTIEMNIDERIHCDNSIELHNGNYYIEKISKT